MRAMSQISKASIARKKSVGSIGEQSDKTHFEEVVHPNEKTEADEGSNYSALVR